MKSIKKLIVLGLALATVVTSTLAFPAESEAKVKLNKTKLELNVGAKFKLKVKGTKKKVKWSTANKKVATVKKGTVKAVAAGSTKITAKIGKKKYLCKVTVKNIVANLPKKPVVSAPPVATPAPVADPQQQMLVNNAMAANIGARADKLVSGDILYTIVNNNAQIVPNVRLSVMLCDSTGAPVDTHSFYIDNLLPGQTTYELYYGVSSKKSLIDTNSSKISVAVTQNASSKKYSTASVSVTGAKNVDNRMVMTYVNNSVQKLYVDGVILYKDANGAVLAADYIDDTVAPGATEFKTLSRPSYEYDMVGHKSGDEIEYATADWVYIAYYY